MGQPVVGDAPRQALTLQSVADQHDAHRRVAQLLRRVEQRVQRVGQAHRPGVAEDRPALLSQRGDRLGDVRPQRRGRACPVFRRDAVGHDMQLVQVEAARGHVLAHLGQHRHHHIGVAVGVGLGLGAQADERVRGRHAGQFDRRQRPQVVHLEDEPGPCQPRDAARDPDVHRVGARGDHRVGTEVTRKTFGLQPQPAQEDRDVPRPADAVAGVGRRRQPAVGDAVDGLVAGHGLARSAHAKTMRRRSAPGGRRAPIRAPGGRAGTPCPAPDCRHSG